MAATISGLKGTIFDVSEELNESYEFAKQRGFAGTLDKYASEYNLSPLLVVFDCVVNGVSQVAVDRGLTGDFKAGQKVECDIRPGPVGFRSQLLSIRHL